jgi:CubicO group peptidase (beta-lactamase class C family)
MTRHWSGARPSRNRKTGSFICPDDVAARCHFNPDLEILSECRKDRSGTWGNSMIVARVRGAMVLGVVLAGSLWPPASASAAPDEDILGKAAGYPIGTGTNWTSDERVRVGSFSHHDRIFQHNRLPRAAAPRPLPRAEKAVDYSYRFEDKNRSIDDLLARRRITGLMVIKDGVVQVERYQYDRTPAHRFTSQSMAKSVTSLGIGFALAERRIRSIDDKASVYAPALAGSPYGETPIRALLRMASGIAFSERMDGNDDLAKFLQIQNAKGTVSGLRAFTRRDHPMNEKFNYASTETMTLGYALKGATGQSLAEYVGRRLWQPMGAEADATWIVDAAGVERPHSSISATLRDWGRLAILLADEGARDGKQIVPRDYLIEATSPQAHPPAFAPRVATSYYGYGYQFWIFPTTARRYGLLGAFGQAIFVDPQLRLALVITAVQRDANSDKDRFGAERNELFRGLVEHYGGKW